MHNDEDAIRMVRRLAELGVRVPGDLALVTYDDEVAALADTPLSAVARQAGGRAVRSRSCWWSGCPGTEPGSEGAAPRRHVALLPALRVRGSCGRPGAEEADRLATV
ncbi:LacI family transcriptional regulator OS=Streptomyces microflavus OX=1919 GN=lacI_1 PE=4 SV=1 [Streptomyces microflavus]